MPPLKSSPDHLLEEVAELRRRVADQEQTARQYQQAQEELAQYRARLAEMVEERTFKLRQSAERYRLLLEASPDAITVYDHQGKVIYVNPAFQRTFGWTLAELQGRGLDFVPPHEQEKTRQAVQRTLQGDNVMLDTQRLTKDGRLLDIQLKTAIFNDAQGNLAGDIVIYRDMTDYARTQAALRQSQERFHLLMEATPDAVVVYNDQGQVTYLNPAFEELYGYTLEEVKGRRIENFVPPEEAEKTGQAWARTLAGEKIILESKRRTKDEQVIDIQLRTAILTGPDGKLLASIVTHRSLVEQKRAEKAINDSRQLLADIIDFLPDATLVVDRQGRVIAWNKAMERLTGVEATDMTGKGDYEYALPFYGQRRPIMVDMALRPDREAPPGYLHMSREGEIWLAENFLPHMKPGGIFLSIAARRLYGHDGEVAGAIECVRDISAYKLAQEELESHRAHLEDLVGERTLELIKANEALNLEIATRLQSERDLLREKERFKLLVEGTPLGISLLGPDGSFEYVNQRFADIFGYTMDEAPTLHDWLARCMPDPQARAAYLAAWQDKAENALATRGSMDSLLTAPCKDGSVKTLQFSWVALQGGGFIFLFEDVTHRREAEVEREKLQAQLRQAQKMEAIGTLAGGIAHDFNNILGAIIGYTELALRAIPPAEKLKRYLERVLKASARATELIQQILAFSRQVERQSMPVQVKVIMKEVVKLLAATLPKTIEIIENVKSEAKVLADPVQIHQVIMNLCTNAAHAMGAKGGTLELSLDEAEIDQPSVSMFGGLAPGRYLRLMVADTGHGMDQATMERVFDPFFTTKPVGEGTGLGLAVVHGIVQSLGGATKIYSEPGRGTAFHVYLPLLLDKKEAPDGERPPAPLSGGQERILVVDDEEMLVEVALEMLEPLGYRVTGLTSSLEALELFNARPQDFDLVITDLTMPGLTGVDLAQKMLAVKPDLPIMLCTGFSDTISGVDYQKIGFKRFILKPLTLDKLSSAIREMLDKKHIRN